MRLSLPTESDIPSVSGKQHRFFEMVAHNPAAAKRVGVPQAVGQDFVEADKAEGKHFPAKKKPSRLAMAMAKSR